MFELPDAKRVRRDQLYDSASEDEAGSDNAVEDAAIRAKLDAQLSNLFVVDFSGPTPSREAEELPLEDVPEATGFPEEQEEEFEFRLFSTAKAGPQKIVLEHNEDDALRYQEGGFVVPERPAYYYLAGEATPEQKATYSLAAVTADEIFQLSKKRAWGLEVPWRVKKITVSSSTFRTLSTGSSDSTATIHIEEEEPSKKRKRPGKKRRILLRTKDKARKEQQEAAEKLKVSKEEHLKEKKKRLNREKKLKRRQKDKEKKLAAHAGSELQGQQEGSESD